MTVEPAVEETAYMQRRGLSDTFKGWTETQRGAYLAVHRGHNRFAAVAEFLGLDVDAVRREVKGTFGDLLWDQSNPDPTLHIRD